MPFLRPKRLPKRLQEELTLRESILTIPINEIFEPREGCPICRMRDMLEQRTTEYIMGAAMMEPDVRIETNRLGFCKTHFDQMLKQKNRLSLALMLQTRLETLKKDVYSKPSFFESKQKRVKSLSKSNSTCFVCSKVDWAMERLLVTVFDMYKNSSEFRSLFKEQEFICAPHCEMLCTAAPDALDRRTALDFRDDCFALARKQIELLYKDVSHFCSMFDYRNNGENADWGNSRDSVERSVEFLTSRKAK